MSSTQAPLPLNDDEYEQLDDLLADMGAQAMDVARLEGYLTALVAGPAAPPQASWLPRVWGDGTASEQATALVLRHHAYMQTWLKKDAASFEPIFDCGGSWTAEAWADGFLQGVALAPEAWASLRASQPALLVPFQRDGANWAARIAPAVIAIHAFWHAPQAKAAKIGRNDPCPCGSGKKLKKCCG